MDHDEWGYLDALSGVIHAIPTICRYYVHKMEPYPTASYNQPSAAFHPAAALVTATAVAEETAKLAVTASFPREPASETPPRSPYTSERLNQVGID